MSITIDRHTNREIASVKYAKDKWFSENAERWAADPTLWANDVLDAFLWSKQQEIANSVRDNPRTAVKSCHGPGKSFDAAVITAWWLDTHPPGTAFVITTAPTNAQVKTILWREITRIFKRAKGRLRGRLNQTEWWQDNEMVAIGRKPSDYDEAAFQGIHAEFVLVIIDEAGGVPKQIFTSALDIATNDGARILVIGNPDDASSEFANVCENPQWNVIKISGFDCPAMTGEVVPTELSKVLVTRRWIEEREEDWGQDNPLYISKVLAEFPKDAADGVVRYSDVHKCKIVHADRLWTPGQLLPVELGIDVGASENGDKTVIRERRGMRALREWEIQSSDPETVTDFMWHCILESHATVVKVDAIGVGWGVVGTLRKQARDTNTRVTVIPVKVGMASKQPEKYAKMRDEIWWEVGRMNSQAMAWDLSDMQNSDITVAELCMPKFTLSNGKIKVESKDELRLRLKHSPDHADALLLAFWEGSGGEATISASQGRLPVGTGIMNRSGGRMLGSAATRSSPRMTS